MKIFFNHKKVQLKEKNLLTCSIDNEKTLSSIKNVLEFKSFKRKELINFGGPKQK